MATRPAVSIVLFTVVVKEAATDGLNSVSLMAYRTVEGSGLLTRIFRTHPQAEAELRTLESLGLTRGKDFLFASMTEGPMGECDGISFSNRGNCAVAQWEAVLDEPH